MTAVATPPLTLTDPPPGPRLPGLAQTLRYTFDEQPDAYAYIRFGGGAHRCLGAPLAMLELEIVLEQIAAQVELSPVTAPAKAVRRGVTLAPGNAGRVDVRPRRRPAAPSAGA